MGKLVECNYSTKYYNLGQILPYQRIFNFINGKRSIGKTYTILKWLIGEAINKGKQFAYICRTQDEKKQGVMRLAITKVVQNEWPMYSIGKDNFVCQLESEDKHITIGYCIALSESLKIKKYSFPDVHYMYFDEYMLEEAGGRYVQGWKEPDLFLSIFHTVDREENRVRAFLTGNNTSFYNPYHMHPAFKIPKVPEDRIWMNKSVLFQRISESEELRDEKKNNLFLKIIANSEYGQYAMGNEYSDDSSEFVSPLSDSVRYMATLQYGDFIMGLYKDITFQWFTISKKVDNTYFMKIALTPNDITEQMAYYRATDNAIIKMLVRAYKVGLVHYESMEVKTKFQPAIRQIVR